MKLSISWIFQHINADWKKVNIKELVDKFNKTTAEIEAYYKVDLDIKNIFVAKVATVEVENVLLYCTELKKEMELPKRENIKKDQLFLVKRDGTNFYWARSSDLGAQKDMALPAISMEEELIAGKWKNDFETQDYIIEVDNKSVTNRPDLWGHRGFAREISAILNLELLPIDKYIIGKSVVEKDKGFSGDNENPFASQIDSAQCKRFATFYIKHVSSKDSVLPILSSLSKIDSRSISTIVDATNYVMFDIGQPMHAFDADKISGKKLYPRLAKSGEKLTLLDGQTIELTDQDLIISDSNGPVALAGVMGGKNSEVDQNTTKVIVEAACFDASSIRKSSLRHKLRTEASSRFEKSLDPNQNILAIERFLKILNVSKVDLQTSNEIISLGNKTQVLIIPVSHGFIEKRIGAKIKKEFIVDILKKLEFGVEFDNQNDEYKVTVPTNRSSKDITIAEDIVEEIGRFFGYENIPFVLPSKQMVPNDMTQVVNIRKIKELMAYASDMHEVQNYPFYDESFLNELGWQPKDTISVMSPVSQNWQRLATSLIPHLLKDIQQNLGKSDKLNFFEFNRIWKLKDKNGIEKKSLAGIFFNHKNPVDFYESKAKLNNLFDMLKIKVDYASFSSDLNNDIWVDDYYNKYQTAKLVHEGKIIGLAGKISPSLLSKIGDGDAFIFEIDGDLLIDYNSAVQKFKPLAKYPIVWLDISMFVSLQNSIDQIVQIIKNADSKIFKVELIDLFSRDDWQDKKSVALRYYFVDENKTLSKEDIDNVINNVVNSVKKIGAQLR